MPFFRPRDVPESEPLAETPIAPSPPAVYWDPSPYGKMAGQFVTVGDYPLPEEVKPRHSWYVPLKAVFDLIGGVIALAVLSTVIGPAYLLVKLTSRGSAFYRQVRLGKDGRSFEILKLRTMAVDAEAATGPVWSTGVDSRVTPIGRFLRASQIDELPQLWNVIRGDMSLIGPAAERPEIAATLDSEIPSYRERLKVRPGLLGLAQVNLPPDVDLQSVRRKLPLDLYYICQMNPWLDARILATAATQAFCATVRHFWRRIQAPTPADVEREVQQARYDAARRTVEQEAAGVPFEGFHSGGYTYRYGGFGSEVLPTGMVTIQGPGPESEAVMASVPEPVAPTWNVEKITLGDQEFAISPAIRLQVGNRMGKYVAEDEAHPWNGTGASPAEAVANWKGNFLDAVRNAFGMRPHERTTAQAELCAEIRQLMGRHAPLDVLMDGVVRQRNAGAILIELDDGKRSVISRDRVVGIESLEPGARLHALALCDRRSHEVLDVLRVFHSPAHAKRAVVGSAEASGLAGVVSTQQLPESSIDWAE